MLNEIEIKGFKSFISQKISLSKVTLLCGFNNSGKSSIIQALRMLSNAHDQNTALLNGYGSVNELRSKFVLPKSTIEFSCKFDDNSTANFSLTDTDFRKPVKAPITYYISADRLGPKVTLPLEQRLSQFPQIGEHGEYVVSFLDPLRQFSVPTLLRHPEAQGSTLEYQLVGWLQEIAPGIEVIYDKDAKRDAGHFEFNTFRPANVGFGLSYCMPILAAVLGLTASPPIVDKDTVDAEDVDGQKWAEDWARTKAERGVLVMIENPEAHLHPSGQTALGRLIALGAKCGVQFLIETQSDHLMDGIRIAVKQEAVTPEDVVFHYLKKGASGETEIDTPTINVEGKLSHWPDGFFDQTLKNRAFLAR